MDTQAVITICVTGLLTVFVIVAAIKDLVREGRQGKIDLVTQQTAKARAEAEREEFISTAESERTKQGEQEAARRGELIRLGRLEAEAERATSGTVTNLPLGSSRKP